MNHGPFHAINIFYLLYKANLKPCINTAETPLQSCTLLTQSFPLECTFCKFFLVLFPAEKLI